MLFPGTVATTAFGFRITAGFDEKPGKIQQA